MNQTSDTYVAAPPTRRERREMQRRNGAGSGVLRRLFIWGGAVIFVVAIGWLAWKAAQQAPAGTGQALSAPVTDADNILGPVDAPVTLVEYSDFQCPGCAAFHPVIQQTLSDEALAGKVRFVYRHFPLTNVHANATLAAWAAEAAGAQEKFWEMHDAIFTGQSTWSSKSQSDAKEIFKGYAQQIGIDVPQWEQDIQSDAVKAKVAADADSAQQSSVSSTPSFFLNGVFLDVFASTDVVGAFRQALQNAVNATP